MRHCCWWFGTNDRKSHGEKPLCHERYAERVCLDSVPCPPHLPKLFFI